MRFKNIKVLFLIIVIAGLIMWAPSERTSAKIQKFNTGKASSEALVKQFDNWKSSKLIVDRDPRMVIPLNWFRGVSAEKIPAYGESRINLADGSVLVKLADLPTGNWDFWLIENVAGPNNSTMPDATDKMIKVGTITSVGDEVTFNGQVSLSQLANFKIDRTALTREGVNPADALVLTGSMTLFNRLQHNLVRDIATPEQQDSRLISSLLGNLDGASVEAASFAMDALVAKGRDIFVNETFAGNGRTCATCHREERNFTIDPAFIATLPPTDPLFVAEFNPALSKNFENPALMRKLGLFLENVDGTDDLDNKFTLRAANHTLALFNSRTPDKTFITDQRPPIDFSPLRPNAPIERLGWGGDGAPGSGTLREFALGAVNQHFTKTLTRKAGTDFRLPTDAELDALEAFQLSLGRQEDFDLKVLRLKTPLASVGQVQFRSDVCCIDATGQTLPGVAKCAVCHFNAGATVGFTPPQVCGTCFPLPFNGNFEIGTENMAGVKANGLPRDGGYGLDLLPNGKGGFGQCIPPIPPFLPNGACTNDFNAPPLVEAADTAPNFHHHLATEVEDAVRFYTTKEFNTSFSALFPLVQPIIITEQQVVQISAFLRVINTLENIRSSIDTSLRAQQMANDSDARHLIKLAAADTDDAVRVLSNGVLRDQLLSTSRNTISVSVLRLNTVKGILGNAMAASNSTTRNAFLNDALSQLRKTRSVLADTATMPKSYQN